MLQSCFSIKLEDKEESIPMICGCCITKLRDSYMFRAQVQVAQDKLKKIVGELTNKIDYSGDIENKSCPDIKNEDDIDYHLDSVFSDGENDLMDIDDLHSTKFVKRELDEGLHDFDNNKKKSRRIEQKHQKRHKKSGRSKKKLKTLESDTNRFICSTCNKEFQSKCLLTKHIKSHSQLFICHICGRESSTKKLLLSHVISHSTEKVQCEICKKFLKKGSMLRHVQNHTGNMFIYPCKLCPEKFPSYNNRLYHLAVAHGIDEKKYACKVCDKAFRFSGGLSNHIKRCHLQEKKCVCTECDKLFFSKNELKKHMVRHTKLRTFQCEICLKSYGRKSTLQAHVKIHSNIKAHKCQICFREFTQKCTLVCHMKVHEKANALQLHQEK